MEIQLQNIINRDICYLLLLKSFVVEIGGWLGRGVDGTGVKDDDISRSHAGTHFNCQSSTPSRTPSRIFLILMDSVVLKIRRKK